MRDIDDYSEKYSMQGFETYKVYYRRKKILEILEKYSSKDILEIGCGNEPLFQYVNEARFTVVEPAQDFYDNALDLAKGNERIVCLCGFFEDVAERLTDGYDMIICSSLLHEVEMPNKLLNAIWQICSKNTIVHINVPNANSMHRLLGKQIGILQDVHDMTRNNIELQQNNVFDSHSLTKIVEDNGFCIIEKGGLFLKPFSHDQMYEMVKKGIIDEKVLDGLYEMGDLMPEFCSEIYVNCRMK